MKYVIMNQGRIDGVLAGTFKTLDHLYYQAPHEESEHAGGHIWTNHLCDAKRFPTEALAWRTARDVYGFSHANRYFVVVSVHDEGFAFAEYNKNQINTKKGVL